MELIFKFEGQLEENSNLIIKSSFYQNIFNISASYDELKPNIKKFKIIKKRIPGSLNLIYLNNKTGSKKSLFVGNTFSKNNFTKYKILYNNKEYKYLNDISDIGNSQLKVKLKIFNSRINLNSFFEECNLLKEISGYLILDPDYIYDLSNMFSECTLLQSLSNVVVYNLNKVNSLYKTFYNCNSLQNIFDISKIDTSSVTNMKFMFSRCHQLSSLPDISNWDTSNVISMRSLFRECLYLKSLPDISKWNIINVRDISHLFESCFALKYIPDISKWNTMNVTDMSYLFYSKHYILHAKEENLINKKGYDSSGDFMQIYNINYEPIELKSSLIELPDISNWNTKNVKKINNMFYCLNLKTLPDISKWDTSNISNMSHLFFGCNKLYSLPDISKWKVSKVTNMSNMFSFVSLKEYPDISYVQNLNLYLIYQNGIS